MSPDIARRLYGTTHNGKDVEEIVLTSSTGATAKLLTYGATLTHLLVKDKSGQLGDVVLGFDNLRQWEFESPYFGATIGRVGNRIANGRFAVDGQPYAVLLNDGPNHLHGGFQGYDKRVWQFDTAVMGGPTVKFTLFDPDGSEGYPGDVEVEVLYTLTPDDTLKIQYFAVSSEPTPINLTNHAYWNLKDAGASPIYDHVLHANADYYVPVDESLTPTGQLAPVKGTAADFTKPKPIGRDITKMGGYDHCYVLRSQNGDLAKAVEVNEPTTGKVMEVWTTEPGVQLYSGNFLDGSAVGKGGFAYNQHSAFCLETQHYPDAVNQPSFPNTILRPGIVYRQVTEYRFTVG